MPLSLAVLTAQQPKTVFPKIFTKQPLAAAAAGDFRQEKKSKALRRPLISSGTFRISADGVEWRTEKPFRSTTKISREGITQTRADGSETFTPFGAAGGGAAEVMSAIFTLDEEAIAKAFDADFSSEGEGWTLSLSPKDSTVSQAVSAIEVRGGDDIESVLLTQANGDTILYTFSNVRHEE